MSRAALTLVPLDALVKTSDLDQAAWNYQRGALGHVQRKRFELGRHLLDFRTHYADILEVGYGSGIFLPELNGRADRVHGVDVHRHDAAVAELLRANGVDADLRVGRAEDLPYGDACFDAVVAVSSLEFVDDINRTCTELARVLRPGGVGVFVTPGHSKLLDRGLRFLTGEDAENTFRGRRQLVLPALRRHFHVEREIRYPRLPSLWLYTAVLVRAMPV
jgi:ubiquinone/menaquinone biosynthesis C-methylase UbiE